MEKEQYEVMYNLEEENWWYKGMRKILFSLLDRYLERKENLRILDAGCGTGINIKHLSKYGKTIGLDSSKEAVRFCKKRGYKIIKGSVEKIPFKDNSFDLITCLEVIYHKDVKSDFKAIKELFRTLKNKGIIVIRVSAFKFLLSKHDKLVHTKRRYTLSEVKKIVEKAGFRIIKISYVNSIVFPFVLLFKLLNTKTKLRNKSHKSDLEATPPFLNKLLTKVLYIESFLLKYINLPVGSSIICIAAK